MRVTYNVYQNLLGTTACARKVIERMFADILFITVRVTNLNFMLGFSIPQNIILCNCNYVVLQLLKRLKYAVIQSTKVI